jgi:hypothetical protein
MPAVLRRVSPAACDKKRGDSFQSSLTRQYKHFQKYVHM